MITIISNIEDARPRRRHSNARRLAGSRLANTLWILLVALCAVARAAQADIWTVGAAPGCDYSLLREAVQAAEASSATDKVVRISGNLTYVRTTINDSMRIEGGYNNCTDVRYTRRSEISSASSFRSLFITSNGSPLDVELDQLEFVRGEAANPLGVTLYGAVNVEMTDVVFNNIHSSGYGGAIFMSASDEGTPHLSIRGRRHQQAELSNNSAGNGGGAIYCHSGSIVLHHVDVEFNSSDRSGGGVMLTDCSMEVFGLTTFFRNTADENGGGIHMTDGSSLSSHPWTFYFSSNEATEEGGAIYMLDSEAHLRNTILAQGKANRGSAIRGEHSVLTMSRAGTDCYESSDACSLVSGNGPVSNGGGAIEMDHSEVEIRHTSFRGNDPVWTLLSLYDTSATFESTLFGGNDAQNLLTFWADADSTEQKELTLRHVTMADSIGANSLIEVRSSGILPAVAIESSILWQPDISSLFSLDGASINVSCSVLSHDIPGPGNLISDPGFVAGYRLGASSLAIDLCQPAGTDTDIDGEERAFDYPNSLNNIAGATADAGADEYGSYPAGQIFRADFEGGDWDGWSDAQN